MQRTKQRKNTSVGGRSNLTKPISLRNEIKEDFKNGKVGARRWVRHLEKQALRNSRYEF